MGNSRHPAPVAEIVRGHRALIERIDDLSRRLSFGSLHERRRHLRDDLTRVLQMLAEHFTLEASSTLLLTREGLARRRHEELLELDREHPLLLAKFESALRFVEEATSSELELESALAEAISRFHEHERREDAIFDEEDSKGGGAPEVLDLRERDSF